MMKFFMIIIFMMMMMMKNKMIMFYYNLCFFLSFMLLFLYKFMNSELEWHHLSLMMGMDNYSYFLLLLTMWISGLMYMSLEKYMINLNMWLFLYLLIILFLVFCSYNMMMFYLFFEISLIPMFFMIILWGLNIERVSAAFYLLMYTMLISLPLLIYIYKLYMYKGSLNFFLLMSGQELSAGWWGYLILFMAFYIKMPLFLFHIWLPKAHVEAPVYGSMVLAGILLKLGGYGLLRMLMIMMKLALKYNYIFFSLSIIGAVVTSLICLVQIDMKSLVAYSSVVHMNILICSLMTMMKMGFVGAFIIMVAHGVCSSGLFYMVNVFYSRSGSRLLLLNKGIMSKMPLMVMWWFMLCIFNFSFPLSINFFGEIFMLMVLLNWELKMMVILMMVCFFSSAYSLYLYSFIVHGQMNILMKFNSGNYKESLILILHLFPLFMYLFNMVMLY